ncbi:hypothetical protein BLA29_002508, partial [Euroglyphus maynei]
MDKHQRQRQRQHHTIQSITFVCRFRYLVLFIMIISIILPLIFIFGLASTTNNPYDNAILRDKIAIQLRLYPGPSTIKLFNHNVHHQNYKLRLFTQNLLNNSKKSAENVKYSRLITDQSSYREQPETGI